MSLACSGGPRPPGAPTLSRSPEHAQLRSHHGSHTSAIHTYVWRGQRARRRAPCLCAIGARATGAQPALALACAPVHDMLMLHTRRTGAMTVWRVRSSGRCKGKGARENRAWFGFYMRWAVGEGLGACWCATVCCVSACPVLSIASDREFDLFQRTYRLSRALKDGRLPSLY